MLVITGSLRVKQRRIAEAELRFDDDADASAEDKSAAAELREEAETAEDAALGAEADHWCGEGDADDEADLEEADEDAELGASVEDEQEDDETGLDEEAEADR